MNSNTISNTESQLLVYILLTHNKHLSYFHPRVRPFGRYKKHVDHGYGDIWI